MLRYTGYFVLLLQTLGLGLGHDTNGLIKILDFPASMSHMCPGLFA